MPAASLRRQLQLLTSEGFCLLPLADLVDAVTSGADLPARTVVITVDDGYEDFASVGAPVFLEFGVPVTVFLTSGFLDRLSWMWWDQLDVAVAERPVPSLEVAGTVFGLAPQSEEQRRVAVHRLAQHLERMPTRDREAALQSIFQQLGSTSSPLPPIPFAPMTWDQVRTLESAGVRFGAHTVTHPILALSDDRQAQWEIQQSYARLQAELKWPVPVLAYPNGDTFTRGPREAEYARGAGLVAAVAMSQRFVMREAVAGNLYEIPRVAVPDDFPTFLQLVAGPELLRQRLRGRS